MRFIGDGHPLTRRESAAQLLSLRRHWEQHGYGLWAAVEKGSGAVIGWAGLAQPTFLPQVMPAVEVGWRLDRAWWGQGLATEAGREGVRFGLDALGLEEIVSIIHPDNAASRRVAEKLGLRPGRETRHPRTRQRVIVYVTAGSSG
jgi:RimJ/RimL family protein N-acetyltransferase